MVHIGNLQRWRSSLVKTTVFTTKYKLQCDRNLFIKNTQESAGLCFGFSTSWAKGNITFTKANWVPITKAETAKPASSRAFLRYHHGILLKLIWRAAARLTGRSSSWDNALRPTEIKIRPIPYFFKWCSSASSVMLPGIDGLLTRTILLYWCILSIIKVT